MKACVRCSAAIVGASCSAPSTHNEVKLASGHGACPDGVLLIPRTFVCWGQLVREEYELARGEVLERVEFAEEDQLVGVPAEFFLKFTDGGLLEWLARFDGPAGPLSAPRGQRRPNARGPAARCRHDQGVQPARGASH
jgi:hypothetical protein